MLQQCYKNIKFFSSHVIIWNFFRFFSTINMNNCAYWGVGYQIHVSFDLRACLEDDKMNRKTKLSERILSLLLVFAIVMPMIPLEFLRQPRSISCDEERGTSN